MKTRYNYSNAPSTILQYQLDSKGQYSYYLLNTQSSGCYLDQLTVYTDYTGPKPRGKVKPFHAHAFIGTRSRDYQGSNESGTAQSFFSRTGWVKPFTRQGTASFNFNNTYNQALSRCYASIRGQVDLSVDLAEAKQTARMVGGYKDKVFVPHANDSKRDVFHSKHLKTVARMDGRVGRLVDVITRINPKDWANKWLEYQYGWRPLVNSIYETASQLMDMHMYSYVRCKGTASDNVWSNDFYNDGYIGGFRETVSLDLKARVKIVALYKMKNDRISRLSNYTSLNPWSITWELVPYSFVVDWVYNIGGYLRNLESSVLFQDQLVDAYYVQGYKRICRGILSQSVGGDSFGQWHACHATADQYDFYKSRGAASMVPQTPSVQAKMGWQRLISAASLLSQHVGKR